MKHRFASTTLSILAVICSLLGLSSARANPVMQLAQGLKIVGVISSSNQEQGKPGVAVIRDTKRNKTMVLKDGQALPQHRGLFVKHISESEVIITNGQIDAPLTHKGFEGFRDSGPRHPRPAPFDSDQMERFAEVEPRSEPFRPRSMGRLGEPRSFEDLNSGEPDSYEDGEPSERAIDALRSLRMRAGAAEFGAEGSQNRTWPLRNFDDAPDPESESWTGGGEIYFEDEIEDLTPY